MITVTFLKLCPGAPLLFLLLKTWFFCFLSESHYIFTDQFYVGNSTITTHTFISGILVSSIFLPSSWNLFSLHIHDHVMIVALYLLLNALWGNKMACSPKSHYLLRKERSFLQTLREVLRKYSFPSHHLETKLNFKCTCCLKGVCQRSKTLRLYWIIGVSNTHIISWLWDLASKHNWKDNKFANQG